MARLQAMAVAPTPDVRLETRADLPTSQASPRRDAQHRGRHRRRAGARHRGGLRGADAGSAAAPRGAAAQAVPAADPRSDPEGDAQHRAQLPLVPRICLGWARRATATLRSTLEASHRDEGGSRVILVTGASPSEGKSTTAVNLASSLAVSGKRVILIEADLRRPALAKALGVGSSERRGRQRPAGPELPRGVSDHPQRLRGQPRVPAREHAGVRLDRRALLDPAARKLIEDARALADYVIIDSPPLNEVVDAMPLARLADDVLIVVRLGKTRLQRISELGELLAENGVRPVGFAVVGVPRPEPRRIPVLPGLDPEKEAPEEEPLAVQGRRRLGLSACR